MVLRRSEMEREGRPQMRGGRGECTLTLVGGRSLQQHLRVLAEIVIPPGASIGRHDHTHETEYYLILEGKGLVDDNGTLVEVHPGDTVITTGGATHSIETIGETPLRMIAVIVTDA